MPIIGVIFAVIILVLISSIRILKEYDRGVVYTLGKYTGTRGAGLQIVIPFVQELVRVDVRIRTEDIPSQDVISKDNVSVRVNAVVYYRVVDPSHAINRVEHFDRATSELAQTTLRSVLGMHELDDMLARREALNSDIQTILDKQTDGWGIKVTDVQIKHIDLDQTMVRAMAKQAEAERERRAKIINSEGELQAAEKLDLAAEILSRRPQTMQLRYLGTLAEFSSSEASTVILPMPMNLLGMVENIANAATKAKKPAA
jgi:regulator of protease activity HflC (stomatin/prohibitin superfamily)|tara:strand:+ start:150945 stop:151718 length:774 start_codon:yes stop_codon:yes gene_type:complete